MKLEWLKSETAPWSKCIEYWHDTFLIRRQQLFSEGSTVTDYFSRFKCLHLNCGSDLVGNIFPMNLHSFHGVIVAVEVRLCSPLSGESTHVVR